jgi:hypothetical protein
VYAGSDVDVGRFVIYMLIRFAVGNFVGRRVQGFRVEGLLSFR